MPTDPDTGALTGVRKHEACQIVKAFDQSSPLLYKAVCNGESFPSLKLEWYRIDEKGEFEIKGKTSIPTYYLLKLSGNKFITLLVDSVDNVFIEADAANFGKEYVVQGSLGSIQIKELTENLNRTERKLDSLRQLNNLYQGNPDYENLTVKWNQEYIALIEEQSKFSTGFVLNNPFAKGS